MLGEQPLNGFAEQRAGFTAACLSFEGSLSSPNPLEGDISSIGGSSAGSAELSLSEFITDLLFQSKVKFLSVSPITAVSRI